MTFKLTKKIEEKFIGLKSGVDYFASGVTIQANTLEVADEIEKQLKDKKIDYTRTNLEFTIL